MRGSPHYQAERLYICSGIDAIGQSKHAAKAEAWASGAKGWHATGKQLQVYSFSTKHAYMDVWAQLMSYVKALPRGEGRIHEMEQIGQIHVEGFLREKIRDGISHATFMKYSAAVEKMETALRLYDQKYHSDDGRHREYHFDLKAVRSEAKDLHRPGPDASRVYDRPDDLRAQIRNDTYRIAAALQHEGGARIREINGLPASALKGNNTIHLTNTKGGRPRDIKVSSETYRALETHMTEHGGRLRFDADNYRSALEKAAEASGQEYTGSHGLRWSYAQERMESLQNEGSSYNEALAEVAQELGHNREDITRHYLR
jgi:hypothetical protein